MNRVWIHHKKKKKQTIRIHSDPARTEEMQCSQPNTLLAPAALTLYSRRFPLIIVSLAYVEAMHAEGSSVHPVQHVYCCCELQLAMGGHHGCRAGLYGLGARDVAPIMALAHVAQASHL